MIKYTYIFDLRNIYSKEIIERERVVLNIFRWGDNINEKI